MRVRHSRKILGAISGVLLLAPVVVACGSEDGGSKSSASGECTTADVLKAVEGMGQEERTAKLQELAEENDEDNKLTIYSSMDAEDLAEIVKPFEDKFGTDVEIADLDSSEIAQRVATEQQAGKTQADVIQLGGQDQQLAAEQGLLSPWTTPYAEGIPDELVYSHFIADYVVGYVFLWNNERMSEGDVPTTYEDLAANPMGSDLGVTAGKWDFAVTLANYLMEKNGWDKDQTIDEMAKMFGGATKYADEAPLAEAVQLGEVKGGIDYDDYYHEFSEKGSKTIEWQPAINPVIVRPSAASITCGTGKPARAVMLGDYLISQESQEIIVKTGRTPSNTNVEGGVLSTGPHTPIYEDMEKIANSETAAEWSEIWDQVTAKQE